MRSRGRWAKKALIISLMLAAQQSGLISAAQGDIHLNGPYSPTKSGSFTVTDNAILDGQVTLMASIVSTEFYTFDGPVSGPGGFIIANSGQLTLTNTNTFQGGVTMDLPTIGFQILTASSPSALGSGSLTMNISNFGDGLFQFQMQPGPVTNFSQPVLLNMTGSASAFFGAVGTASGQQVSFSSLTTQGTTPLYLYQVNPSIPVTSWNFSTLQLGGALSLSSAALTFTPGGFGFATTNLVMPTLDVTLGSITETSVSALSTGSNTVHFTGQANFSGGLNNGGVSIAEAVDSLGTGPVTNSGTLILAAPDAARSTISGGVVLYNTNGALSGNIIQNASVTFGPSVTSLSDGTHNDSFVNIPSVVGDSATLALLDRGIGAGTSKVSFAPLATV